MSDPVRHVPYVTGKPCSVAGCLHPAEFEVYLYDFYPEPLNEQFFEQDFTCPYLCHAHMDENEVGAVGERKPRGYVSYPYSNQGHAQGYTTYAPLSTVFPLLYDASSPLMNPASIANTVAVNEELLAFLAANPELMRDIEPRRFEEVVAELFRKRGFSVQLTPQTRDGGRDLLAVNSGSLGKSLYLVECKRYAENRKVGVEVVRGLYGVLQAERATKGIIVTTSSFTRDAVAFASPLEYQLSLRDYDALRDWLDAFRGEAV